MVQALVAFYRPGEIDQNRRSQAIRGPGGRGAIERKIVLWYQFKWGDSSLLAACLISCAYQCILETRKVYQ